MGYDVGICKVKWERPASCYVDGKQTQTKEYAVWRAMIQRGKVGYKFKSYNDVVVHENFKNYDSFYDWYTQQIGYGELDDKGQSFQLDKDLLGDGTLYSPEFCLLLPREINNATVKPKQTKELPTGVYRSGKKFTCRISRYNIEESLGNYQTVEEALHVYNTAKINHLKDLAEKWKEKIDQRAYKALINYEI